VSYASAKGYIAEHSIELWLEETLQLPLERPRAGSPQDRGDLIGLPFTVSVKNRANLALSGWVDEMTAMTARNGHQAGIVIHKRRNRGHPKHWYVATTGDLWLPMARAYVEQARRNVVGL
jgi:hypothetical protein